MSTSRFGKPSRSCSGRPGRWCRKRSNAFRGAPRLSHFPPPRNQLRLIPVSPTPPPLRRESRCHAGRIDHRTDCSSARHKEGLRSCSQWEVLTMKLSAPIYHLKRRAKRMSREEGIPLHDALDRTAATEGFSAWSMLAAKAAAATPAKRLLPQFQPGDLVLVGARPGQGKTLMSLELAVEAMRSV